VVVLKLDKVELIESLAEFPDDVGSILRADAKGDQRAGVTEDGMPYLWFELV